MNVSNVGTNRSVQHEAYQPVQEKANSASASETKEMGGDCGDIYNAGNGTENGRSYSTTY